MSKNTNNTQKQETNQQQPETTTTTTTTETTTTQTTAQNTAPEQAPQAPQIDFNGAELDDATKAAISAAFASASAAGNVLPGGAVVINVTVPGAKKEGFCKPWTTKKTVTVCVVAGAVVAITVGGILLWKHFHKDAGCDAADADYLDTNTAAKAVFASQALRAELLG